MAADTPTNADQLLDVVGKAMRQAGFTPVGPACRVLPHQDPILLRFRDSDGRDIVIPVVETEVITLQ